MVCKIIIAIILLVSLVSPAFGEVGSPVISGVSWEPVWISNNLSGVSIESGSGVTIFAGTITLYISEYGGIHITTGQTIFLSPNSGMFSNSGGSTYIFDAFGNSKDLGDL